MFSCYIPLCSDFLITWQFNRCKAIASLSLYRTTEDLLSWEQENAYVFGEFANHMGNDVTQLLLTITESPHTRQTLQELGS